MAPAPSLVFLRRSLLTAVLLCVVVPSCMSDGAPEDTVGPALTCFNDRNVYSGCQESYRLSAQGSINVPYEATDAYCGGPCLAETNLLLSCIDGILNSFKFYNGASVRDVQYTLKRGCGHGSGRGYFDVHEHKQGVYGGDFQGDDYGDYYYGGGNAHAVPVAVLLLLLSSCALLFWVL